MSIINKKLLVLFLTLIALSAKGQTNSLFEGIAFTDSMKLAVMHSHTDQDDTYISYDLIIDSKQVFDSVAPLFTYGEEVANFVDEAEPTINLITGKKTIKSWSINPKNSSVRIKGKSYQFDTEKIKDLASNYPLEYTTEKKAFKSLKEFEDFKSSIQNDDLFLFMYEPNFKYEGSFQVRYKKSNKFRSPQDVSQHLKASLTEITEEDNFRIFYMFNDYNRKNRNQFTMTVESSRDLYDEFSDRKSKKLDWEDTVYSARVFKIKTYNNR